MIIGIFSIVNLKIMIDKILNFMFPKKCLECGKQGEHYICSSCFNLIKVNSRIFEIKNKNYNYFAYMDIYTDKLRKQMLKFKFSGKAYYAEYFIDVLSKNKQVLKFLKNFDVIIPVPMHKNKRELRGYNQTELLAKWLSKKINVIYDFNVLYKKAENKTQSLLSKQERLENVCKVFEVKNNNKISNKNIILLDDIFTTGATVEICSKILKLFGASTICVLTIAKV